MIKGLQKEKARQLIDRIIKNSTERPLWLSAAEKSELLTCYGISQAEIVFARTMSEAQAAAEKLGFPVAIKLESPTITHKTDVGGVVLNVSSKSEVEKAYNTIKKNLPSFHLRSSMH